MSIETTVTGRIAEPELRYTQQGKAVLDLRICATRRALNKNTNEWADDGEPHGAHLGAVCLRGTGHARGGDGPVRIAACFGAHRHLEGGELVDDPLRVDQLRIHPGQAGLEVSGVGDEAAAVDDRGAGHRGEGRTDAAAGERLAGGERHGPVGHLLDHIFCRGHQAPSSRPSGQPTWPALPCLRMFQAWRR